MSNLYSKKRYGRCCVVPLCSMKSGTNNLSQIKSHRFPKDVMRRSMWIQAIRRENWCPKSYSSVCSLHFIEGKPSLDPNHPDWIPNIFPFKPRDKQKEERTVSRFKRMIKRRDLASSSSILVQGGQQSGKSGKSGNLPKDMRNYMEYKLMGSVKRVKVVEGCVPTKFEWCMLCPTTKVIGMEDPSIESTVLKSQVPLIDFPQVASIKQELILPDDGTKQSFIDLISEPTRVEMMFSVDQNESSTEPESVPPDAQTVKDVTDSNAATPNVFAHTQTLNRRFYAKSRSVQKTTISTDSDISAGHLKPHARPQIMTLTRELSNHPDSLVARKKTTLSYSSPQTSFTGQLQEQHVTAQQVLTNAQSQQSANSQAQVLIIKQSQVPLIDLPQVASIKQELILPDDIASIKQEPILPDDVASIKQELILPDDGTCVSLISSSSEPTRVKMFCINQDKSTAKLKSVPSDNAAMDVTENSTVTHDAFAHTQTFLQWSSGQVSSSTAMDVTTSCNIAPMPVDLNLVKKEVDDETLGP